MGFCAKRESNICGNHPTAKANPMVVLQKLNKEVDSGHMAGPFLTSPVDNIVTNPLGLIPKTNEQGLNLPSLFPDQESSYRMITDLKKSGVNQGIPEEFTKVQYSKFDQAVQLCIDERAGCYMAKLDIKSAYRNVPVHPDDRHLICCKFLNGFYVDKCLPFGLSSACSIFETVSTAMDALVQAALSNPKLLHYLDDFFRAKAQVQACNDQIHKIIQICEDIGLLVAPNKTVWSTKFLRFLGLDLDSEHQMIFWRRFAMY